MTWAPDYATSAELKHQLAPGISDTLDDAEIALALKAASRAVDTYCGRQFGQVASPVARYYSPTSHGTGAVVIDDLMDVTGLVVKTDASGDGSFPTTLAINTDVRLYPWNAAADGRPWIMLVGQRGTRLPCRARGVEITARWGWSAVPAEVKQATLIQASRIFKRKDAPFGIAGSPELGSELRLLDRLDPDVAVLLAGLRRLSWVAVTV